MPQIKLFITTCIYAKKINTIYGNGWNIFPSFYQWHIEEGGNALLSFWTNIITIVPLFKRINYPYYRSVPSHRNYCVFNNAFFFCISLTARLIYKLSLVCFHVYNCEIFSHFTRMLITKYYIMRNQEREKNSSILLLFVTVWIISFCIKKFFQFLKTHYKIKDIFVYILIYIYFFEIRHKSKVSSEWKKNSKYILSNRSFKNEGKWCK